MRLGSGTFSRVTRDVDRPEYAVKETSGVDFDCAVKELLILKSLNHANVISVVKVEFAGDATCRTWMKCYPDSLGNALKNIDVRPVDMREFLRFAVGFASAVNHIHSRNIIHGDIKPDNILMTAEWDPVLCDFNIARINIGRSYMSGKVQTRLYRAPEVKFIKKNTKYNELIDVWSVGCALWEVLTGAYVIAPDTGDDTTVGACEFMGFTTADNRKQRIAILKTVRREHVAETLRKKIQQSNPFSRTIVHDKYKKLFLENMLQIIAYALVPLPKQRANANRILSMTIDLVNQCTEVDVGIKLKVIAPGDTGRFAELRNNRKNLNGNVSVASREEIEILDGCDVVTSLVASKLAAKSAVLLAGPAARYEMSDQYIPPVLTRALINIACAYIAACLLDEDIEFRVKKYIPIDRDRVYVVSSVLEAIQYDINCVL